MYKIDAKEEIASSYNSHTIEKVLDMRYIPGILGPIIPYNPEFSPPKVVLSDEDMRELILQVPVRID